MASDQDPCRILTSPRFSVTLAVPAARFTVDGTLSSFSCSPTPISAVTRDIRRFGFAWSRPTTGAKRLAVDTCSGLEGVTASGPMVMFSPKASVSDVGADTTTESGEGEENSSAAWAAPGVGTATSASQEQGEDGAGTPDDDHRTSTGGA